MSVRITLALLCIALVSLISACGGNSVSGRSSSARGIITCKPGSGTSGGVSKGSLIYFYDDGSSSPNGPIVKYEWDFGNGWEEMKSYVIPHVLEKSGTINIRYKVTDSTGDSATVKLPIKVNDKYDASPVFEVLGPFESDEYDQSSGQRLKYHRWTWATLSYDPDDPDYDDPGILDVSTLPPGDPDFDLLRVIHSAGDRDDFCGIDIDGDATGDDLDFDKTDDDPSLKRTFVFPHVLETSGRCLSKSKEDVYVWKIKSASGKHTKTGHVTLLK